MVFSWQLTLPFTRYHCVKWRIDQEVLIKHTPEDEISVGGYILPDWAVPRSEELHQPNKDQTTTSSLHLYLSGWSFAVQLLVDRHSLKMEPAEADYSCLHGVV